MIKQQSSYDKSLKNGLDMYETCGIIQSKKSMWQEIINGCFIVDQISKIPQYYFNMPSKYDYTIT